MFSVCCGETLHVVTFTQIGPETVVTTVCWWTCDVGKDFKLFSKTCFSFCFFPAPKQCFEEVLPHAGTAGTGRCLSQH